MSLRLAPRWRAFLRSRVLVTGVYLAAMAVLFVAAERAAAGLAGIALRHLPFIAKASPPSAPAQPKAALPRSAPHKVAMSTPPRPGASANISRVQGWYGYWRDPDEYDGERERSWRRRGWDDDDYERYEDDDDDEDRPRRRERRSSSGWNGTYRTVCVRLCDGYYWPISFATTSNYFQRDRDKCESSCGSPARLYVFRNGGEPEDMVDLQGKPYSALKTAFLYRTQYDANCKCKPDPWEQASKDRHRMYALEAARKKGDKTVTKELEELKAKVVAESNDSMAQAARNIGTDEPPRAARGQEVTTLSASPSDPDESRAAEEARARAARNAIRQGRMSLGRQSPSQPSSSGAHRNSARTWADIRNASP